MRGTIDLRFVSSLPAPLKLRRSTTVREPEHEPSLVAVAAPAPQPSPRNALLFELTRRLSQSLRCLLSFWPTSWPLRPSLPPSLNTSQRLSGCTVPLFRPYVAKVPWHGGVRAFLSQLFPRYGHYCGPNWSSGRDGGSMLWDRRPIDWLDFCCYCHDIGYDTHDQSILLQADLAFLECLEKSRMATKGDAYAGLLYRSMCIAGLRSILIPYRMQLLRLQAGPSIVQLLGNLMPKGLRSILIPYRMQLLRLQAGPLIVQLLGNLMPKG